MLPGPNRKVTVEILADKIRFLHNFGDLRWETTINGNLLVSELLTEKQAKQCLEKILADGPKQNAKAFSIVKSSANPPDSRVAVKLDELDADETLKLSTRKQKIRLELITSFLNQVHSPDPQTGWYVAYDNARGNYIAYGAPSIRNPLGATMVKYGIKLMSGMNVQKGMFEFSEAAKNAVFSDAIIKKFTESLTMTDDGRSCIYTFKDDKFLDDLFAMIRNKKDLKFIQETTAEVLQGSKGIPRDVGRLASTFLGVMEAGRLAQTSKAAGAKAKKTLQAEETGEKAGEKTIEKESTRSKRDDESAPGQESEELKSELSNDEIIYPESEGENPAETAGTKEKESSRLTRSEESVPVPKSNPLLFYSGGTSSTSDDDEIIYPSSDKKNEPEKSPRRKK